MTAASTVIVGGGVVGCAAAFFLAERGERDVVLLERGQLGQGTSKGGLGGIRVRNVFVAPVEPDPTVRRSTFR